jgi:hypothetical protein
MEEKKVLIGTWCLVRGTWYVVRGDLQTCRLADLQTGYRGFTTFRSSSTEGHFLILVGLGHIERFRRRTRQINCSRTNQSLPTCVESLPSPSVRWF